MTNAVSAVPRSVATAVAMMALAGTASASTIKTDLVFVLDTSGSLRTTAPAIGDGLATLAGEFAANGVDARFGLVTFQDNVYAPIVNQDLTADLDEIRSVLTDPLLDQENADCSRTDCLLAPGEARPGQQENGLHGIAVALNGVTNFRRIKPEAAFGFNSTLRDIRERTPYPSERVTVAPNPALGIPEDDFAVQTGILDEGNWDDWLAAMSDEDRARIEALFEVSVTGFTTARFLEAGPQAETLSYRDDAIKNVVVISDERDFSLNQTKYTTLSTGEDMNSVIDLIDLALAENALVNVIGDPPDVAAGEELGFTQSYLYGLLASATGGNIFDLDALDPDDPDAIASFFDTFAAVKLQELVDVCTADPSNPACDLADDSGPGDAEVIPLPASAWLLLAGLGALGFTRRRGPPRIAA